MKAVMLFTVVTLAWGCATAPAPGGKTAPAKTTAVAPFKAAVPASGPAVKPAGRPVVLCGANILISYRGARRVRPGVTRTRKEARDLVLDLAARARKDPSIFAELARKHSDGPAASRGGYIGVWTAGRMPIFGRTILELEVGAVSVPVASPFGFHVLKRLPVPIMFAASHILISFAGVKRLKATRSREEARQLAGKLALQAAAEPGTFAALARKHSDCPSAPKGGVLGVFRKGLMVPAFQIALEAQKVGQISGVIETKFGFHVIRRDAVPGMTKTQ